jgi:hypothetical protein
MVVDTPYFTGKYALTDDGQPSSWWNDTRAVLVEGSSGVIVYGELGPDSLRVKTGDSVSAGTALGRVDVAVLRSFKGRPMVMLHLELMAHGSRDTVWWTLRPQQYQRVKAEQEQDPECTRPAGLMDPTPRLMEAASAVCDAGGRAPLVFDLQTYNGRSFVDPEAPRKPSPYWEVWGGRC